MTEIAGFRLSVQQALAWRNAQQRMGWGPRGVFALPVGATAGDVQAALRNVVQRHEILRTEVKAVAGVPLQFVNDAAALHWEEQGAVPSVEHLLAQPHAFAEPLAATWLTLDTEPLLFLSMHRLHGDAATLKCIAEEVRAWLCGKAMQSDPVQYADYAQWQHEVIASDSPARSFWHSRKPAALARLPLEEDGTGMFTPREHLVNAHGTAPESAVFSAWALLLARHVDQPSFTLGVVHEGRTEEVADACGPYESVLPLLLRYDPGLSRMAWERALHQERSACETQAEHHAGCEVALQYRCADAVDGARILAAEPAFHLRLEVLQHPGHLALRLAYDATRFSDTSIKALALQLNTLLAAHACMDAAIGDVSLLSGPDLADATAGLAIDGEPQLPAAEQSSLLHELISQQARRHGSRIAVSCNGRRLSYAELDERAQALAQRLVAAGAGPDQIVAVCMQRSVDLVIALLGVMKAGAAYLPLDPSYPADRLDFMLQDSGARQMVVHAATSSSAPSGVQTLAIDATEPIGRAFALPRAHLDQLAYVIYTSGSTGRPKGVAITQRNALHSTLARHRWYAGEVRAYLLLSSVAFDSSVAGIFWTLTQGGELVLPKEGDHRDAAALSRLAEVHQVSHLLALPSLYAQLLDERERLGSLSHAIVAGEACPASLAKSHALALPQAELINEYGPTEATVWSTAERVAATDEPVSIGRPIPFIRAFVLDDALRPTPVGLAGELCIGGPALARGYLGRPELTAERFVPHPFAHGERLYRTGDRVRCRGDGRLDFLGRFDDQVKLRGFRIELGEIEARLAEYPGVAESVAMVREDRGEQRLVAYVVAGNAGELPAQVLRAHLARSLPEFLIPSAFVSLDVLPRTPNGKIDRQALPAPQDPSHGTRVAPRSVNESLIAAIWCDLLGKDAVGVHDNFFELGGHSLLATQVITRVRKSFGIELAVRELFAAPTVAGLAQAVARQRLAGRGLSEVPLQPVVRQAEMPLSFAQQRLWFLAQLEPEDPSYHIAGSLRLSGSFEPTAWSSSFQGLQQHHEILRTCFAANADGRPVQHITDAPMAELQFEDLSGLADPHGEAARRAREEAMRPFSLAQGPLLRASLLRLAPQAHQLVLVMHHIISDGASTERLLQDWATLYRHELDTQAPTLPALPIQYADYAHWQRTQLSEEALAEELAYWRQVLGDEQPLLALPADRPRPPSLSGRGGQVPFSLDLAFSQAARAWAGRRNASLFMLMESVFAALLSRHAGQLDVRVGTPVSGRDRLELEPLVGLFVNTVVLRHQLAPLDSLNTLLDATRRSVLDATQHQQLPFERLVDALVPARDLSHQPLFQAMFDMQTERYAGLASLPGLSVSVQAIDTATSKFDLSLSCTDNGKHITGHFEYSTDLFDHSTIERLARQYEQLLVAALDAPDRPLADLPLLSEMQAAALCHAPVVDLPLARGFASLLQDMVASHACSVAVSDEHGQLSYHDLWHRASMLAAGLQAAGAEPDAPVAILLPRSNDYLVAIVACLIVGSPWLPLDMALPQERLHQMMALAQPRVMVAWPASEQASGSCAQLGQAVRIVGPDASALGMLRPVQVHPAGLAYVIFTSGSTGVPKAAMVTQAGMLNNLLGKIEQLQLTPADCIAQTASPCFDISVWQFLTALLCGAQVIILPDDTTRDPAGLLRATHERGISVVEIVPSLMRGMLTDPDAPAHLPTLRTLLPTGEALPPALARQWLARFPSVPLLNAYGPAECADDVALWRIDEAPPEGTTHLPIGKPAANLRLYVLNDAMQIQPAGVTGELAIGGIGVGRGYLNDAALTAERFVPDPYGPPGARLYRSGDLVRQSPDGVITFLGRRDHQVKVRGYRVEPGEVEACLLQHDGVRAAAVVAQGDPVRLVAYVAGDGDLHAAGLRRFLAEKLPDYMVPALCVLLDELPLNANGKLDRHRLPQPDPMSGAAAETVLHGDPPQTAIQATLARIWADVLRVASVRLQDNFFALGGDSILVIQVVSKARDAGLRLTVKSLFMHQTVEALATVAEPLEALQQRTAPKGEVPLTPIQQAFFEQHSTYPHHWNQSVLLTLARPLNEALLQAAIAALAQRHDALRLRFTQEAGAWLQRHAEVEAAALVLSQSVADVAGLQPACNAVQASLDIEHGPLWRVGLFTLPHGEQHLLLAVHHLVVDGLSLRILIEDLAKVYGQLERGEAPRLSGRTASFQDWAIDLHQRSAQGEFDEELAFWRQQTAPGLRVDRPEGSSLEGDAERVSLRLSRDATLRLLQSSELRARPDDFLLTALAHVLAQWSGVDAIAVEQESHGRPEHLDVSATVGWFTTAYPVRLPIDTTATGVAQLKQVKQALRCVPRAGVGYGVLRYLRRSLNVETPAVSFNYLGQLDGSVDGALFAALHTDSGRLYHALSPRACEFDLNSYVIGGELQLDWRYGRERHARSTVQALAERFIERLAELLQQVRPEQGIDLLTPQDFPEAALDDAALAQLLEGME